MAKSTLAFGVTYHGSVPEPLGGLDNVYGKHISAKSLRNHLKWLRKHFQILGLGELIRCIRKGERIPNNSLFIVFHDGYRDNYYVAFSLLNELGLTATFLLATDFIETGNRFWVDVLDAALKNTEKKAIEVVTRFGKELIPLTNGGDKYDGALKLRNILKSLSSEQFEKHFSEVLSDLGYLNRDSVPWLGEHEHCMDWSMVRKMSEAGMEFGSHSHRHLICARQDRITTKEEMNISKKIIEEETGRECEIFCYPNGNYPRDGNDDTDVIASRLGYKMVLYMVGPYNLLHSDTFRLTGIAYGEGSDMRELKRTLSKKRYYWWKLRRSTIWPWDTDSLKQ